MGEVSGFHGLLGLEVDDAVDGQARVRLRAGDDHLNRAGSVHGGAIATLVDTAMGAAVASTTDDGERPVTIEIKVNYLEPGQAGMLLASAQVRRRGRRVTVVEAEVTQDGGDVLALATGTFATV